MQLLAVAVRGWRRRVFACCALWPRIRGKRAPRGCPRRDRRCKRILNGSRSELRSEIAPYRRNSQRFRRGLRFFLRFTV